MSFVYPGCIGFMYSQAKAFTVSDQPGLPYSGLIGESCFCIGLFEKPNCSVAGSGALPVSLRGSQNNPSLPLASSSASAVSCCSQKITANINASFGAALPILSKARCFDNPYASQLHFQMWTKSMASRLVSLANCFNSSLVFILFSFSMTSSGIGGTRS